MDTSCKAAGHGPELPNEPLVRLLRGAVRWAVRLLAAIMVLAIFWGVFDVAVTLFRKILTPPYFIIDIDEIVAIFGAFLAVLIAVEIFENIIVYLRGEHIQVRLVLATALVAVARKIIILDIKAVGALNAASLGLLLVALGFCLWLARRCDDGS